MGGLSEEDAQTVRDGFAEFLADPGRKQLVTELWQIDNDFVDKIWNDGKPLKGLERALERRQVDATKMNERRGDLHHLLNLATVAELPGEVLRNLRTQYESGQVLQSGSFVPEICRGELQLLFSDKTHNHLRPGLSQGLHETNAPIASQNGTVIGTVIDTDSVHEDPLTVSQRMAIKTSKDELSKSPQFDSLLNLLSAEFYLWQSNFTKAQKLTHLKQKFAEYATQKPPRRVVVMFLQRTESCHALDDLWDACSKESAFLEHVGRTLFLIKLPQSPRDEYVPIIATRQAILARLLPNGSIK
jgi:hypothetical protein